MRISVIGRGYPGATHATCLAAVGHDVVGVDPERVTALAQGRAPFHEPRLDDLLVRGMQRGNLAFTTESGAATDADREADIVHVLTDWDEEAVECGS